MPSAGPHDPEDTVGEERVVSLAFSNFDVSTKQIFWGNILLAVCCAFYRAWWLLAFKPVGAVKGIKTGWLLIPAFAAGLAAVILLLRGIGAAAVTTELFPIRYVLLGGAAAYVILLAATLLLLKRPVTTELFLIVGWAMLALAEVNTLYGTGRFSHGASLALSVVIGAAALVSLVCYVLYYKLDSGAGYLDGMVPLLLAALIMVGISIGMVLRRA